MSLYIHETELSIQTTTKSFWNFVNSKHKSTNLPSTMFYQDKIADNDNTIVNRFSIFCSSIYSQNNLNCSVTENGFNTWIADIDISISDVFKKLSTLDTNKGPGMYGILPWYSLKRVALFITASLAYFQPVIEEREFSVALENYVNCFQIRRRI